MSKIVPGLHHKRTTVVVPMTVRSDGEGMDMGKGFAINGTEAVHQMEDGKLYYVPTKAHIVYLRWDGLQFHTVAVSIQDYVANRGNKRYFDLTKELAIYLVEGLHPDIIFDILSL